VNLSSRKHVASANSNVVGLAWRGKEALEARHFVWDVGVGRFARNSVEASNRN